VTDRILLLLTLGILAAPLSGCPSTPTDDDDATSDDDDATSDDDDATSDDDDATSDDDDATSDDDDSAGPTVTALTVTADATTATTRGAITLSFSADWSDLSVTAPTEADGLTVTFTTTAGTDDETWSEPTLSSEFIATIDIVASLDGVDSAPVTVDFTGAPVLAGDIIVHEVLVDGTAGDANGDGTTDADQDAFVEFLNTTSVELDLAGCTVTERDFDPSLPRHTFDQGDSVKPGQALVVFGGGSADITPAGATVVVADNASDPGTPLFLHLDPNGDIVRFRNAAGDLVDELAYGSEGTGGLPDANLDESITRSPQLTGTSWDAHGTVAGDPSVIFSPGTLADGSSF
jgi:hypothetical protein